MGPLAGVRVIELAGLGAAPLCGMMLADLGAEVILIDRPGKPSAESQLHVNKVDPLTRSKRRIALDLKQERDIQLLKAIVDVADVLLESFRPGVMERLGLAPESCHQTNPSLVYARLTGWGQSGPWAQAAGHDPNYVAATGALYHSGHLGCAEDPPTSPPTLLGDGATAALLTAAIASALLAANRTGLGEVIDASIAESSNYLATYAKSFYDAGQLSDVRGGEWLDGGAPWNCTYRTKDDGFMVVASVEPKFYRTFLETIGLEQDPLFSDFDQWSRDKWPVQKAALKNRFLQKCRDEWITQFSNVDACVTPVLTYAESPLHPQFQARGAHVCIDGQYVPASAPRFTHFRQAHVNIAQDEDLTAYLASIGIADEFISH